MFLISTHKYLLSGSNFKERTWKSGNLGDFYSNPAQRCRKPALVLTNWYEEEGEGTFCLFSFPFAFFLLLSFKSLLPPFIFVFSEDKTVALPPTVPDPVPPHHGCGNHSCVSKMWSGHQTLCPTSCLCSRRSFCTDRK